MILNLHGLYGHRENNNYRQLVQLFPDEELYSPQLDYEAENPRELLARLAAGGPYTLVVGNSLGGFFAYALGASEGFHTVLTNPCIPPHEYLGGLADSYRFMSDLEEIWKAAYPGEFDCTAIVGSRDEVIDHERTLELMQPHHRVFTIDTMHSMSGPEYANCFKRACEEAFQS